MYVPSWIIPVIVTIVLFGIMIRPYRSSGDYDFGEIFRAFWLIPMFCVWSIYFGILLLLKG